MSFSPDITLAPGWPLPVAPEQKQPSAFLRALCRALLLAPIDSDERRELSEIVKRVAAESGVDEAPALRAAAADLVEEGLLP